MLGLVFIATITLSLHPAELLVFNDLTEKVWSARYDFTYREDGQLDECRVTESSGDPELDKIFCKSAEVCLSLDDDQREAEECMTREQIRLTGDLARSRVVVEPRSSIPSDITIEF